MAHRTIAGNNVALLDGVLQTQNRVRVIWAAQVRQVGFRSSPAVNAELADYATKIVTIGEKETARDGFAQLQVEEIPKF